MAAIIFAGCSGSVHETPAESAPLLVIHGHVDLAALERTAPDAPLMGALVWTALPTVDPACLLFDAPELRAACPDPYGVFLGEVAQTAPVAADGTFALEINNLPAAQHSVGDAVTRITYGSVLAFEDVNRDGNFWLPGGPPGPKPQGGAAADAVVAASFHNLRAPQVRVAFREGGFVENSHYYPAPGCSAVPRGFSLVSIPPYVDGAPPPEPCRVQASDGQVEVSPLPPAEAVALSCRRSLYGRPWVFRARDPGPEASDKLNWVCLSREVLASIFPGRCPDFAIFAIKGCEADVRCTKPEWDDTASPPRWWPCH